MKQGTTKVVGNIVTENVGGIEGKVIHDRTNMIMVVSGLGGCKVVSYLTDYDEISNPMNLRDVPSYITMWKLIFSDDKFGARKSKWNNMYLWEVGGTKDEAKLWVGKVVLLYRTEADRDGNKNKFSFVH